MHFDIADLRLLVHLAEAKSLTRGADRAALSPAAASGRLKALEAQADARLFYRDSKGLRLTAAGDLLLRHARVILHQVEHARSDLTELNAGDSGHVRIFANTTAIIEVLPPVLVRFMVGRPAVTVDVEERATREVVRGIQDSAADIGIVAGAVHLDGLQSHCFSQDRLVLVTPADHPLRSRDSISWERAMGWPHVGLQGSTLQGFLSEIAEAAGRRLTTRVLMRSFEAMGRMIEAGVGVGVLPESAARRHARTMWLHIVHLQDGWSVRERRVLYRELEGLPGCSKAFIRTLIDHA